MTATMGRMTLSFAESDLDRITASHAWLAACVDGVVSTSGAVVAWVVAWAALA